MTSTMKSEAGSPRPSAHSALISCLTVRGCGGRLSATVAGHPMARLTPLLPLILCGIVAASSDPQAGVQAQAQIVPAALTREAMAEFLRSARVVRSRRLDRGTTLPWRLTLSDGRLTHDAAFQSVDERATNRELSDGRTGDSSSWTGAHFNIAQRISACRDGRAGRDDAGDRRAHMERT